MTRFTKYVSILLALAIAVPMFAAGGRRRSVELTPEVKITGTVRDAATNAPIVNASVWTNPRKKELTNEQGQFELMVPQDRPTAVTFERSGYDKKVATITAQADQSFDILLAGKPTTTVVLLDGTSHILETESTFWAYYVPFLGPVRGETVALCTTGGGTWTTDRALIAKVVGPAENVSYTPCCKDNPVTSIKFQLKSGQELTGYFTDSCIGNAMDFGGVIRSTGRIEYFRLTNVKEIVFP